MQRTSGAWSALAVAALAAIGAFVISNVPTRAADDDSQDGRIVDLSADGTGGLGHSGSAPAAAEQAPAEPTYWLGIQGQPLDSAVLRTHLQLADDVGVVVENIVKDSPAAKAGLRVHDILIAVNGEQITDMTVLQHAVAASQGKPVALKLIRLAKEETLEVTPEPRPERLAAQDFANPLLDPAHGNLPMGDWQELLQRLQQNQFGENGARMFGNGMVFNMPGFGAAQIPNGVAVSITRNGDGPATVTVKKGDQTWTVQGDDAEAIKNLPDDVRPFVERLLASQQQGGAGNWEGVFNRNLEGILPDGLGRFNHDLHERAAELGGRAEQLNRDMMQRLEEMEKRIEELQQQLEHGSSPDQGNHEADPAKI
jgi:membrane-associated protease RseP (regulator of RpoE activity)